MKEERNVVDGTPHKRLFWSIISDYSFETAILELIDNSIDVWIQRGQLRPLEISVEADCDRQIITVKDNAGGVAASDIGLLITPGGSDNDPDAHSIGVFGVGSKRAVVALGEQVSIKTRHLSETTYQIDITRDWIEAEDWNLPVYEVATIDCNTTIVEVSQLRTPVSLEEVSDLSLKIGETYAYFIENLGCHITVNGVHVDPVRFDCFAFPPQYPPTETVVAISPDGKGEVLVTIQAGLIRDRDPKGDNYGVYVYCNRRLIVKELRSRDVGYFVTGEAGTPHPDASLCRVIIEFEGPAKLMPWTSNKAGIVAKHPTFQRLSKTILALCTRYTKISRATKQNWEEEVFQYTDGKFEELSEEAATTGRKLVLPTVPRSNKSKIEHLKQANVQVTESKPYVMGLIEGIAAADLVLSSRLETANRVALILIDSTFEIAMKEWMVHNKILYGKLDLQTLFNNRGDTVDHFKRFAPIDPDLLEVATHFSDFRNKMIHERATFSVSDQDIRRYRKVVCKMLSDLFVVQWPS
jgi:hypothetical protein